MKIKWKRFLFLLLGICLCAYPIISNGIEAMKQKNILKTYSKVVQKENTNQILKDAIKYNDILYQTKGALIGDSANKILDPSNYERLLNVSGNGIMGEIEIPKISVRLPIWHGTSDEVISNGVGHLRGSSLPIGGKNTRSILTSHRGLPSAKLFTRLDELKEGDLFYITVCDEKLAYQVNNIEVIEPEDVNRLNVIADQDLVSLLTCTPYGINTHRLVVTGERVKYSEAVYETIKPEIFSMRELIFFFMPFLVLMIAIIKLWIERKRRRYRCFEKKKIPENLNSLYDDRFADRNQCKSRRKRQHYN